MHDRVIGKDDAHLRKRSVVTLVSPKDLDDAGCSDKWVELPSLVADDRGMKLDVRELRHSREP